MARTRVIKPNFFLNEDLAECDPLARLLFQGLWQHADFRGVLEYRPKRLKAQILPYDECDIGMLVGQLTNGFITVFSVGSKSYIWILNFNKHQKPHKKEIDAGSELPDPSIVTENPGISGAGSGKTGTSFPLTLNPIPLTGDPDPDPKDEVLESKDSRTSSPELEKPSSTPNGADRVLLEFPVTGKTKVWKLTKVKYAEWYKLYGDVLDVSFEMRKAHRWILDHPKKKKTPGGMPAFLTIWMNSATNSGRGSSPPSREETERRKRKSREMAKADAEQRRRATEASKRSGDTAPEPIGDLLDTTKGEG